jgi:hypothetical protein
MGNEQSQQQAGGNAAQNSAEPAERPRAPAPTPPRPVTVQERLFQVSMAASELEAAYDDYVCSKSASQQASVNAALGRDGSASGTDAAGLPALPVPVLRAPALDASKAQQGKYIHERALHLMLFLDTLDVSEDQTLRASRKELLKRLHTVADKGTALEAATK